MSEISESDLHAYVDGQLDDARATEVSDYLQAHPAELERVRAYAAQKQAIRAALYQWSAQAESPLTRFLAQRLERKMSRRSHWSWFRHAAAMLLLVGSGWWGHHIYQEYVEDRVPDFVEDATGAYLVFSHDRFRPVEITAAAKETMVSWFSRQLGEPVLVPDLRPLGLELIGGRLLGTNMGPLAQLLYQDREGRRLALSISPDEAGVDEAVTITELNGVTVGYWRDDELAYALVAETTGEQLMAIASELGALETGAL